MAQTSTNVCILDENRNVTCVRAEVSRAAGEMNSLRRRCRDDDNNIMDCEEATLRDKTISGDLALML